MTIMWVPTELLEWSQAGQGRPLVGACLLPAGKGREQGLPKQSCKSNRGLTQNPSGSDGVSDWCLWQQENEEGIFSLFTLACQLAVRGHFSKLSTFLKAEWLPWQHEPCPEPSCILLLADTVTLWQHCQSSCTWHQGVPIAGVSHLKHRLLSGLTALLMLFSFDSALQRERNCWWSQQQKREVGFSTQCRWYVSLAITVLGRALSYMDPEGICRLCGVAGAGWNQAGIRISH